MNSLEAAFRAISNPGPDNGPTRMDEVKALNAELLAALERAETYIATHGGVGFNEPLKSIRAAIAKAKGAA